MLFTKQINCLSKQYKNGFLSTIITNNLPKLLTSIQIRCFASAPAVPSGAQPIGKRRFRLPVEQDVDKVVNYCCGANYFKDGEEIKLKADEEYPEWIWSLRLNYPPRLHEMDQNTHEFWEMAAKIGKQREWRLKSVSRQRFKIVSERIKDLEELRYRRRFRALASKEYDAGYEVIEHSEREDFWNLEKKDRFREPEETEPFYPGIDSIDIPYEVKANRIWLRHNKKVGRFGW